MAYKIDNFELDENNQEFNYAVNLVNKTNKLIYLTGKAGSGKTTFLKFIKEITNKKTVVLAPTGVAALNAGGQTIHSFFKIAPSIYLPDDYRLRTKFEISDDNHSTIFDNFKYRKDRLKLIKSMELLIIDEISMVRCDLLDVVDKLLRVFRDKEELPFGGCQVLLIGDAYQLPPIAQDNQWQLLKEHYKSPFFFSSKVLTKHKPFYIELKKIYRQQDDVFINLLNNIRENKVNDEDMKLLNSRFIPAVAKNDNLKHVTIATHNNIVDEINQRKLGELQTTLKIYEADVSGNFPASMYPTDNNLKLKIGSQVMFIRNDTEKKYYNGKIGTIVQMDDDKIFVEVPEGNLIEVKPYSWSNIRYVWDAENFKIVEDVIGEFIQFPLKLAWSVTVHKCQGLTFDNVIADIGNSFSPGQVYVALSRCRSIEGLVLKSRISRSAIKTDPNVIEFTNLEHNQDENQLFDYF